MNTSLMVNEVNFRNFTGCTDDSTYEKGLIWNDTKSRVRVVSLKTNFEVNE